MRLIKKQFDPYHISMDSLRDMEVAVLMDWKSQSEFGLKQLTTNILYWIWRFHWRLKKYYGIDILWVPKVISQRSHHFDPHHIAFDTVMAIENSVPNQFENATDLFFGELIPSIIYSIWLFHLRVRKRLHLNFPIVPKILTNRLALHQPYMVVLMGANFKKCLPYFNFSTHKSLYLFDAWPEFHERIKDFADDHNVDTIFVSSSQAAKQLQSLVKKTKCYWVPEAIDASEYKFYPLEEKNIDILSFGRKYDLYHQKIVDSLAVGKKNYLYEKIKGHSVLTSRETFVDGLARSKISICFPLSMTNPDRSGGIETMTNRYLESMASKCLIVGHAPEEMIQLFGYNPVIEVDWNDPAGQLTFILNNYDNFLALVEQNYWLVVREHTWERRWTQILELLSNIL